MEQQPQHPLQEMADALRSSAAILAVTAVAAVASLHFVGNAQAAPTAPHEAVHAPQPTTVHHPEAMANASHHKDQTGANIFDGLLLGGAFIVAFRFLEAARSSD